MMMSQQSDVSKTAQYKVCCRLIVDMASFDSHIHSPKAWTRLKCAQIFGAEVALGGAMPNQALNLLRDAAVFNICDKNPDTGNHEAGHFQQLGGWQCICAW
jgi:hypothetical protein